MPVTDSRVMVTVRGFDSATDLPGVMGIDRTLTSDGVVTVDLREDGVRLGERACDPVRRELFPLSPAELASHDDGDAWVAIQDDRVVGFLAVDHEDWNRRSVVFHFYVDLSMRRRGVGRSLLTRARQAAREQGARCLWLETSSLNLPGYRAYRALGFSLCGLDSTLYDPHGPAAGQVALFLSRSVD